MKIIFNLTLDNGTVIGGVENDLRDLVINGVTCLLYTSPSPRD